jgi:hypothetical protein
MHLHVTISFFVTFTFIFTFAFTAILDRCGVVASERSDCGSPDPLVVLDEASCVARGCCYDAAATPYSCYMQKQSNRIYHCSLII